MNYTNLFAIVVCGILLHHILASWRQRQATTDHEKLLNSFLASWRTQNIILDEIKEHLRELSGWPKKKIDFSSPLTSASSTPFLMEDPGVPSDWEYSKNSNGRHVWRSKTTGAVAPAIQPTKFGQNPKDPLDSQA